MDEKDDKRERARDSDLLKKAKEDYEKQQVPILIHRVVRRRLDRVQANLMLREGLKLPLGGCIYFILSENSHLHRQVVDLEEQLATAQARILKLKERLRAKEQ